MVAIDFSVFKQEIIDGVKKQTIRLKSPKWDRVYIKHQVNKKQLLQLYWHLRQKDCELLREEPLTEIILKQLGFLGEEIAKRDGFKSEVDLRIWFWDKYKGILLPTQEVYVIRW